MVAKLFSQASDPDGIHTFASSTFHIHYCMILHMCLSVGNRKCRAMKSHSKLTTVSWGTDWIKHGVLFTTSTNLSNFSAIGNINLHSVCVASSLLILLPPFFHSSDPLTHIIHSPSYFFFVFYNGSHFHTLLLHFLVCMVGSLVLHFF